MEIKACIVSKQTNVVENVIVLGTPWMAPEGFYLVVSETGAIGDVYDKNTATFIKTDLAKL